jgi:hypothetical protein
MSDITTTLCAINRRADRALVQELRLMTQEILALRTQLTLEDRAHADALLLKLDHLARCQCVETATPRASCAPAADAGGLPSLPITLLPLEPSSFLVHFYSHDLGDLEKVLLTESLGAAAQLVRTHLEQRERPVTRLQHRSTDGALSFLSGEDMLLASIEPCEPCVPAVDPQVALACTALAAGDVGALRQLFQASAPTKTAALV